MIRLGDAMRRTAPAVVSGAVYGAVILGLGGRVAMRVIAMQSGTPAILTVGGTVTVVLSGIASGLGGILLHFVADRLARWLTPAMEALLGHGARPNDGSSHRWVRRILFALLLLLITVRGLHPVQPLSLALFAPLVAFYGAMIEIAATRRDRRGSPRDSVVMLPT
jgi:hypothetical protein